VDENFNAALVIDNLLDTDPPRFGANTFGLGYDSANADPVGRYVSLRLNKAW
jgi:outer membrane receptor protein involved in Fe transport